MLGTLDKIRILQKINIFHDLVLDELAAISRICRRIWFDSGSVIFNGNDPEDAIYVVIEGEVDILLETKTGEKVIKHLQKNELFSGMIILTGEERRVIARARADSLMFEIRKDDLQEILRIYPNLTLKMFRFLSGPQEKLGEKSYEN